MVGFGLEESLKRGLKVKYLGRHYVDEVNGSGESIDPVCGGHRGLGKEG